jgi:hypothetical protein
MFKKPLLLEIIVALATVVALDYTARAYHLYWSIYEFDSLVHFIAGITLGLFFIWLYFFSGFFNPQKRSLKKFILISVLGSLVVGVSWEVFELIFKQTMVQKVDYPYDLMMDLLMDVLGAVSGCFYAFLREQKINAKS